MATGCACSNAPRPGPDVRLLLTPLLTLLFYAVLTPAALLLRALRVDVVGRRFDDSAASYWRRCGPGDR